MSVGPGVDGQVGGERERRRAERRRIDAEQEVVHDRVADGDQVEHVVPLDAGVRGELADQRRRLPARTASVSCSRPPGFIITYDTRLIRSSPNRIWGFMAPAVASTSPLPSSQRWPAMVVEPTSTATP